MAGLSLNIGLKSLLAAQAALDTIGHNVSNVNTPGYSRQSLSLSASTSISLRGLAFGGGVNADTIQRTVDTLLGKRIAMQISALGRLDGTLFGMSEVEALLGEPGAFGISSLLEGFFGGISALATDPSDPSLRNGLVQSTRNLTSQFNQLSSSLGVLAQDTMSQVTANVERVNQLAQRIVKLNQNISSAEAAGMAPNDLRDQRALAVQELAQLASITAHEDASGAVRIMVSGRLLVGATTAHEMHAEVTGQNDIAITIGTSQREVQITGGLIGGLLQFGQGFVPGLQADLDGLASNLIFEVNKLHSTGVPSSGAFQSLTGVYAIEDSDGDGNLQDELLSDAGLPFAVQSGELFVNVVDEATGQVTTHTIAIDAARTTVGDLIAAFDEIPSLNAGLDGAGRFQILSESGAGFHFGGGLLTTTDAVGSFGGSQASLGTGQQAPFALSDGDTLDLVGPLGASINLTFDAGDFADISQATAEELAAVINADANIQAGGMRAVVVGDQLVLQTEAGGSAVSFDVTGGSALGALGWTAGTVSGHDSALEIEISGKYTGSGNGELRFVPSGDGVIGTTPGLEVLVYDAAGSLVATLDVGAGYLPGTELGLGDGLRVSFGLGELSASNNDSFVAPLVTDSDSADVLVALGLNALLTGRDASDISVRQDILDDPSRLATSANGVEGDNTILLDLIALEGVDVGGLGGITLGEFYGDVVSGIGFDIESARNARSTDQFLMDSLAARREQISGVNLDEELVKMIEFEQAFAAATRFIQVVSDLNDELLAMI